jgi:hypothetical protein
MKIQKLACTALAGVLMLITSCTGIKIEDDQAVIQDIQGTWTGYDQIGSFYRHVKVNIAGNTFNGWLQTTESPEVPAWSALPNETGTLSISSILEDPIETGKYRKISFFMRGRCCGDNSLTARTLSDMITYQDGRGLCVARQVAMMRN